MRISLRLLALLTFAITFLSVSAYNKSEPTIEESNIDVPVEYLETIDEYALLIENVMVDSFDEDLNNGKFLSPNAKLDYEWGAMLADIKDGERKFTEKSFGYSLIDINSDGVQELFLLREDGVILALFSIFKEKSCLLDAYWSKRKCNLTDSGELQVLSIGGAQDFEYTIQALDKENPSLITIKCFGARDGKYFKCVNDEFKRITEDQFQELSEKFLSRTVVLSMQHIVGG